MGSDHTDVQLQQRGQRLLATHPALPNAAAATLAATRTGLVTRTGKLRQAPDCFFLMEDSVQKQLSGK